MLSGSSTTGWRLCFACPKPGHWCVVSMGMCQAQPCTRTAELIALKVLWLAGAAGGFSSLALLHFKVPNMRLDALAAGQPCRVRDLRRSACAVVSRICFWWRPVQQGEASLTCSPVGSRQIPPCLCGSQP